MAQTLGETERERQSAYIPTMDDDYDDDNDDDRNELQVGKKFILISKVKEKKKIAKSQLDTHEWKDGIWYAWNLARTHS